jgi:DNA-binding response OmpR family regulator
VLVVEDDRDIANLLELHLGDLGCRVTVARDGNSGLQEVRSRKFDLIILDLMLPGIEGLELCRRIRERTEPGRYTPILMVTAKSSELDRVVGLEVGADDYLAKPFSIRELIARVKAIFRRVEAMAASGGRSSGLLAVGELSIDEEKRKVTLSGRDVALTAKEFDLLLHFVRNPGRVYTRTQLLDSVWGYGHDSYQHTVNSHINRLRAKIEKEPGKPTLIQTVWGVGYKFADPADRPSASEAG